MKRLFTLIISIVIVMVACSKKKDTSHGTITATITGTSGTIHFTSQTIGEVTFSGGPGQYQYAFQANAADSSVILLNLSPITTGTQSFGLGVYSPGLYYSAHGGQYYQSTNQAYTMAAPGVIDITSSGASGASGTFSGTLYSRTTSDSVVITNGVFTNCTY